ATGDVTFSGTAGATTAIVTGSGATYTVAVSGMTASGTVIATIPTGVVHDSLGNGNSPSTSTDNTVTFIACTGPTIACPPPVTVPCLTAVPAADFAGGNTSGGCGTVTVTHVGDSQSVPGSSCNNVITRTYKATDSEDNVSTCTQAITVNDTNAPTATQGTIASCHADATSANNAALAATTDLTD